MPDTSNRLQHLITDIQHIEGRPVTENDYDWIRRRISKLHETALEKGDDYDEWYEQTTPVEEAFHALSLRGEQLTAPQVSVMKQVLRGHISRQDATDQLPDRTLSEIRETSILHNNTELAASLRKDMAGLIPEFQHEVDDDTVYCEQCDTELGYTPSELGVHNARRHEEAM